MDLANRLPLWSAVIAVLATAALLLVGNGLNPVWGCMWVAPLPVLLLAAASTSWRLVAAAAALSMFLGSLTMLYYLHFFLRAPVVAWLLPFSGASLIFAIGVLLYRALLRRKRVLAAVISLPAMWALLEYLVSIATANGTAGSLAYTQLGFPPIAQLASITGPWGITFVLLLLPCGVAAATFLWSFEARPLAFRVARLVLPITIAVLLYGLVRLNSSPTKENVEVGLLATDSVEMGEGNTMKTLIAAYGTQAELLARRGAQIVVMPEKVGILDSSTEVVVNSTLQSVSDRTGSVLVIGVVNT